MRRTIIALALNTFRESVRSNTLYSIVFFAVLICAAAFAFGRVTIGDQSLVVVDFGLFCSSFFSTLFAVIAGSSIFAKEIARKTIFTILARPLARSEILLGKWLGLLMTSIALLLLMLVSLSFYAQSLFAFDALIILEAGFFIFCELLILCSLVIFFSSLVVTPLLIGAFSMALFLIGRNASYFTQFIERDHQSPVFVLLLEGIYFLLPKFELIAMSDRLVAGQILLATDYYYAFCYAVGYSIITLIVASLIFKQREFN